MWKEHNIHLIATSKPSKLCIYKGDELIWLNPGLISKKTDSGYNNQYLYITSDEEIKDRDCYINGKYVYQADRYYVKAENDKKIIATTDSSCEYITFNCDGLGNDLHEILPKIATSFIKQYITKYNEGNSIDKVKVEYYNIFDPIDITIIDENSIVADDNLKLKVNSDNTINIQSIKN